MYIMITGIKLHATLIKLLQCYNNQYSWVAQLNSNWMTKIIYISCA